MATVIDPKQQVDNTKYPHQMTMNAPTVLTDVYFDVEGTAHSPARPGIRWNATAAQLEYSNDGAVWSAIGSGGGGIPNGIAYTVSSWTAMANINAGDIVVAIIMEDLAGQGSKALLFDRIQSINGTANLSKGAVPYQAKDQVDALIHMGASQNTALMPWIKADGTMFHPFTNSRFRHLQIGEAVTSATVGNPVDIQFGQIEVSTPAAVLAQIEVGDTVAIMENGVMPIHDNPLGLTEIYMAYNDTSLAHLAPPVVNQSALMVAMASQQDGYFSMSSLDWCMSNAVIEPAFGGAPAVPKVGLFSNLDIGTGVLTSATPHNVTGMMRVWGLDAGGANVIQEFVNLNFAGIGAGNLEINLVNTYSRILFTLVQYNNNETNSFKMSIFTGTDDHILAWEIEEEKRIIGYGGGVPLGHAYLDFGTPDIDMTPHEFLEVEMPFWMNFRNDPSYLQMPVGAQYGMVGRTVTTGALTLEQMAVPDLGDLWFYALGWGTGGSSGNPYKKYYMSGKTPQVSPATGFPIFMTFAFLQQSGIGSIDFLFPNRTTFAGDRIYTDREAFGFNTIFQGTQWGMRGLGQVIVKGVSSVTVNTFVPGYTSGMTNSILAALLLGGSF